MSSKTEVVAFAGSTRQDSLNSKLIRVAAAGAKVAGASVRLLDLTDYTMPLYNGDLEKEHGLPAAARELKEIMRRSDGLLVAAPEYNSSITPLLKNTIDWVSRAEDGEPPLVAYRGKVAGLLSASPGRLGGLRGLVHLRAILTNCGMHVIPAQRAISGAASAFDESGDMISESDRDGVYAVARSLVETAGKLRVV